MELFLKYQIGTHLYSTINNSVVSSKQDKKIGESSWPRLRAEWCVGPIFLQSRLGKRPFWPQRLPRLQLNCVEYRFFAIAADYQKKSLYLHLSGRCAAVAYPWRNILMKVFSLLSLDRNLVNFTRTGVGNYIHHLVWCTVHSAQSPYGCGVLFICSWAYQSLYPDKRNCSTLFCLL